MSSLEDGQELQEQNQSTQQRQQQPQPQPQPHTPLNNTNEASNTNNSIMGKVKLRVSSILPDSLSKWFSPTIEGAASAALDEEQLYLQHEQQHNGSALASSQIKRKRGRRRINLEADDAPDMDDGLDAQDLNDEEVQIADNIAEHDLVADEEQARRREFHVSLLRKSQSGQSVGARDTNDDDDDDDDEYIEDDDDEEPDDDVHNYQQQLPNRSAGFRKANTTQPPQKRKRLEPQQPAETTFSPQFSAQRRRPQLHASTPSASEPLRSHAPPNRLVYLNLYGHQRTREPPHNFLTGTSGSEAAVATSGDLPMSARRLLNIAPMTERRDTLLPSYKRQSLLGQRAQPNWRTCTPIGEDTNYEQQQEESQTTLQRDETNNNNNIINSKRGIGGGTDSHSECESNESHPGGSSGVSMGIGMRAHNNNNNNNNSSSNNINSNQLFYGNLQSRKSVFNSNAATPSHHNSTLSLNSLNNRRRFNASIYGSTSALSDSRLLCSNILSTASPFYQGPTAFGGSSANSRYFSQGNLAINSGGSSPAPSNSDSINSTSSKFITNYSMKPVEMRPRAKTGSKSDIPINTGLSQTAQRILNLLENHTTPLMDAKKMGSTLREHQQQRCNRHANKPYCFPTMYNNYNRTNNSSYEEDNSNKLLVPTMLELLERRRLHRVTPITRQMLDAKQQQAQQKLKMPETVGNVNAPSTTSSSSSTNSPSIAMGSLSHTNKMRSRLSHQTRKDARNVDEHLPPPTVELPDIRFPTMANEPKFDLNILLPKQKPTTLATLGASTTPAVATPATAAPTPPLTATPAPNFSNSFTNNKKTAGKTFSFNAPLEIHMNPTSLPSLPQKRDKPIFKFNSPISLDQYAEQIKLLPSKTLNGTSNINNNNSSSSSNNTTTLKSSGVVLDVVVPPTPATIAVTTATTVASFGDQFKKTASEWECEACMVRNKLEASKCIACETSKPKPKVVALTSTTVATTTTATSNIGSFSGFGDRFKQPTNNWECDACMLSNKSDATKCIACETPRKNKGSTGSSSSSNSSSSCSNISNSLPLTTGFGDAFKPKANTWECGTCLVMNQSSSAECIACQTANPNANANANASSSNSSNSFQFGVPTAASAPKADANFQQLIAAQKANNWNCEACMAQNEITRNKCVCCEQLKPGASNEQSNALITPKFMFGFSSNIATPAAAAATTPAAPKVVATTPFKFGFAAAGKDVADKPLATATPPTPTTTAAAATFNNSATGFKFGADPPPKAVSFKLDNVTQETAAKTGDTTAPVSSKAPATSSSGLGLFTATVTGTASTAAAAPTTTSAKTAPTFAFGAFNSSTSVTATTFNKPLLTFGAFATPTAVSSAGSSSTSSSSGGSSNLKPVTGLFSSQPVATTTTTTTAAATTTATATNLFFGQQKPVAATTVSAAITALVATSTATPAKFVFGSSSSSAATATTSSSSNAFFFGGATPATTALPPAASATAATKVTPAMTSVSSAGIFGSIPSIKSSNATSNASSGLFTFGSGANSNSSAFGSAAFSFGGAKPTAETPFNSNTSISTSTTTTAISSFGWPTAATTAATTPVATTTISSTLPIFGSGSSMFSMAAATTSAAAATTNAAQPLTANSPFGMPTTPSITGGGTGGGGGSSGGGIGSAFGSVSNPFGNGNNTFGGTSTAMGAPLAYMLSNSGNNMNVAATTTTPAAAAAKPAFNFGSTASVAPSSGVFNFGGIASNQAATSGGGIAKPSFNFTGNTSAAAAPTVPQTAAFNFTANAGTGSNAAGGGGAFNPPPQQRLFQFGITGSSSDVAAGGAIGPGSSIGPASSQLFNFSATTPQMQSTPTAAPFQFNAGASAPANIFAFNPPNAGSATQNPRRKIRPQMRRQQPR